MKNIKRLIRRKEKGFTIYEVLIALLILALVVTSFLGALSTDVKTSMIIAKGQGAKNLAEIIMQKIMVLSYNATVEGETTAYGPTNIFDLIPLKYRNQGYLADIILAYPHSPDKNLQEIVVQIYTTSNSNIIRALVNYKVNQ